MRPFRFGLIWPGTGSPVELARRAEDVGYATLLFPDHTGMMAPLPAMAAAAAVTTRLRLGSQVINIAFRPLGALAQELAAVDVISDGRLEVGLGAGYAEAEVRSLGLPFPSSGARLDEVSRALRVLPRLFAGERVSEEGRLVEFALQPVPPQGAVVPFMVGGNGDRMLAVAAEQAQIVQFTGFTATPKLDFRWFSAAGLHNRLAHVRDRAGARFDEIELSVLVQLSGVDADPALRVESMRAASGGDDSVETVLGSPFVLLEKSVDEVVERVVELRERFGISYFTVFEGRSDRFDEVVGRLAGQ
jgi:probable F420-dependent oxidoreductase